MERVTGLHELLTAPHASVCLSYASVCFGEVDQSFRASVLTLPVDGARRTRRMMTKRIMFSLLITGSHDSTGNLSVTWSESRKQYSRECG